MNQKYLNDPDFKMLVDTMEKLIHDNRYTPSEMREAALMASIVGLEKKLKRKQIEIRKLWKTVNETK
jgi:hypothetical protein